MCGSDSSWTYQARCSPAERDSIRHSVELNCIALQIKGETIRSQSCSQVRRAEDATDRDGGTRSCGRSLLRTFFARTVVWSGTMRLVERLGMFSARAIVLRPSHPPDSSGLATLTTFTAVLSESLLRDRLRDSRISRRRAALKLTRGPGVAAQTAAYPSSA